VDKGIVITAFNSGDVDYHIIAEANCRGIKSMCSWPITVITDCAWESKHIDNFVIAESGTPTIRRDQALSTDRWLNQNRYQVYDLSPYEHTLLLDADFFIGNRSIFKLFDTQHEFLIAKDSVDVISHSPVEPRFISPMSPELVYATAIYFSKTALVKNIFDRAGTVKDNWDYYQTLYQFNSKFRNDFAFAFALHEINMGISVQDFYMDLVIYNLTPGQILDYKSDIPWIMMPDIENHRIGLHGINLHVLNKKIAEQHARWVLDYE